MRTNFLNDETITEQERYIYAIEYIADLSYEFDCCLACVPDNKEFPDESCENCFTRKVYDYLMKFSPKE